MNSEEKIFLNHLKDLDRMALEKNKAFFSDFMDPYEYSLFLTNNKLFSSYMDTYNLVDNLERQMVAFRSDASFVDEYPIDFIKIEPKSAKFAGEITHRDILGTIMGLQIERKNIGDILACDGFFVVLCKNTMTEMLLNSIDRVRRTDVKLSKIDDIQNLDFGTRFIEKTSSVSSNRLDALISEIFNLSRGTASELVKDEVVFVNNKLVTKCTYECKDGDKISVRKHGKVRIDEIGDINRKGKTKVKFSLYK